MTSVASFAELHLGDCLDVMQSMDADSLDSIVCDPPYGLAFMGKNWDHGIPGAAFWAEALRVAKPGAHLLAFGGTRTFHRLAVAIEDAGWEIRDTVMWVYGSGFPKSLDVSKAIDKAAGAEREVVGIAKGAGMSANKPSVGTFRDDAWVPAGQDLPVTAPATDAAREWHGWGTALKPAWEPIIVARKPLEGTVAANILKHGCGGLNIDGSRIELNGDYKCGANGRPSQTGLGDNYKPSAANQHSNVGRFPANLIHDGSPEVVTLFPVTGPSNVRPPTGKDDRGVPGFVMRRADTQERGVSDSGGSAARFFYAAKASKADREEGNTHPTVKPTALMRYLVRLVTPPKGVCADIFMGSGSTGKAAMLEGFNFVGIEREPEYFEIAKARIAAAQRQQTLEPDAA